ncbi:MAG: chromate efflux transporter [Methylococcaceae bacterium]|jgi:chromate transporter
MSLEEQFLSTSNPPPVATVSFWQAAAYWLKLGFISFGGPAGQIALMHQDLVEKKHWISEQRFLHALNYCMVLPGPEAQQLATYLGWLMHKTWGGIIAGSLFVLPSLLILTFLGWIYLAYGHLELVANILYGIKPAVTAIVFFAAYRIGLRTLKNAWLWAISSLAFLAIFWLHLAFPYIILAAALLGTLGGKLKPEKFNLGGGQKLKQPYFGTAQINDDTPTPGHARFSWPGLIRIIFIGFILWAGAMGLLCFVYGWHGVLTQMAWFFTKAAWLTFGGAYAVLPYVYQGAVEQYHWLNAGQMIDALALGETTPGPLVMVVSFVAFITGWEQAFLGNGQLFLSGAVAAAVITYFTFLPSFVLIFAGGPLIESTHGNLKFTAPLTGITAAIVGVIVNLAAFFAYPVFWPMGFSGSFDYFATIISLCALLALLRFQIGVVKVIIASALSGLCINFLKSGTF